MYVSTVTGAVHRGTEVESQTRDCGYQVKSFRQPDIASGLDFLFLSLFSLLFLSLLFIYDSSSFLVEALKSTQMRVLWRRNGYLNSKDEIANKSCCLRAVLSRLFAIITSAVLV